MCHTPILDLVDCGCGHFGAHAAIDVGLHSSLLQCDIGVIYEFSLGVFDVSGDFNNHTLAGIHSGACRDWLIVTKPTQSYPRGRCGWYP